MASSLTDIANEESGAAQVLARKLAAHPAWADLMELLKAEAVKGGEAFVTDVLPAALKILIPLAVAAL